MKKVCMSLIVLSALALTSLACLAQDVKKEKPTPLVTVVLSSYDRLLDDIKMVGETAENEALPNMINLPFQMAIGADIYESFDKKQPAGYTYLYQGTENFGHLVFLPITDEETFIDSLSDKLDFTLDKDKDGLYTCTAALTNVYMRYEKNRLWISDKKEFLNNLPKNITDLTDGIEKEYTLGVHVFMQNLPKNIKDAFYDQIMKGVNMGLVQEDDETDEAFNQRKAKAVTDIEALKHQFEDLISFRSGLYTDKKNKSIIESGSLKVKEGSATAKNIALQKDLICKYSGFTEIGAMFSLFAASKTNLNDPEIKKQMDISLRSMDTTISNMIKEIKLISGANELKVTDKVWDEINELLKKAFRGLIRDKGDMGCAGDINMGNTNIVMAMSTSDAEAIRKLFVHFSNITVNNKKFFMESGTDIEDITTNMTLDIWENYVFSSMKLQLKDSDLKNVFGKEISFILGTGKETALLAFGSDPLPMLKKALKATGEKTHFKGVFSMHKYLNFLGNVISTQIRQFYPEENAEEQVEKSMQVFKLIDDLFNSVPDSDKFVLRTKYTDDSVEFTLTAEKGITKILGSLPTIIMLLQNQ